jgi:conjugal transfer pilus assembly protein TraW
MKEEGKLEILQQEMATKTKERLRHPRPVQGLKTAEMYRAWTFDPTLTLQKDLKDHKGHVFAKKGDRVNPLDYASFGKPLLLIDGTQETQIAWAQSQEGVMVLTNGSPFGVMEAFSDSQTHHANHSFTQNISQTRSIPHPHTRSRMQRIPGTRHVFFDQGGWICRKFGVNAVPAKISQQEKLLLVEEISLEGVIDKSPLEEQGS